MSEVRSLYFVRRTCRSGSSKHAGGVADKRCDVTHVTRYPVFAVALRAGTASSIRLKTAGDVVIAEERLPLRGEILLLFTLLNIALTPLDIVTLQELHHWIKEVVFIPQPHENKTILRSPGRMLALTLQLTPFRIPRA